MAIIFIRSTITYVVLLILMRFMGKRQIGEMQPFEFIITLLISELACIPMTDVSIPLLYGLSAMLAVFILHQLMSVLEQSGKFMKFALSGKPSVVITKTGVDFKELKKNNLDVDDLIESMRSLGYFALDSVDYAIYESNGKLSAVEKKTNGEEYSPSSLPILIVKSGKPFEKNLQIASLSENDVIAIANKEGISRLKNVDVLTIDGDGNYYIQQDGRQYKTGKYVLKGGTKW
ncbi:MAG: DUF421 domain-containing protein [Clostridia bacterium]|nr:DUF421 domain-containing protein [Clostridia bacterium]